MVRLYIFCYILKTNIISDSKRQQTTTVDYKRLINGYFLTNFVTLQRKNNSTQNVNECQTLVLLYIN